MAVYRRGKIWYINITLGGVRIQRPAGSSKRLALEVQAELRAKFRNRELHVEDLQRSVPFSYAADRYLEHVEASRSKRSAELERTDYANHLADFFGAIALPDITNDLLLQFQAMQKKNKYANRTVNIHVGLVRKILRHAEQLELTGPVRLRFPMLREARKTHAFIPPASMRKFLAALQTDTAYGRVVFGVVTGMRPAELAFLSWNDIDLKMRLAWVRSKPPDFTIKTEQERVVPLNDSAMQVLKQRSTGRRGPWVFSDTDRPVRSIRRALKTAARIAGIDRPITPNMLRHTFATYALMNGADVRSVQAILGHANLETTMRYVHALGQQTRKAVDALRLPVRRPATKLLQNKKTGSRVKP